MADIEQTVARLRRTIDEAARSRARAEAERDAAQGRMDEGWKRLREEFGIESPEDARRVLGEIDAELAEAVAEVETALSQAREKEHA